ncbi:carboxymuconolactone decarboxylase family protein [Streptomyces sp. NPDC090036]|uniref:carboxymuconolactone decarboxylase family protein n=1 Tax=Streptomyces sp. NPDC090036 TaxID=3365926 RepID=UPI0037FC6FFD
MSYGTQVRDELRAPGRELRRAIPQVYEGYKQLHDSALESGALDAKTTELIALAIAVSKEVTAASPITPRRPSGTAPPSRRQPRP